MKAGSIKILILCIVMANLLSCVQDPQDIPSGATGDPIFGLQGTFGNEQISIDAGKNGWTMLPVVMEVDSLLVYTSVFSLNGCIEDCFPSWTFRFYQALPVVGNPASAFQNTLSAGEKDLVISDFEKDSFQVILSTHPGLFMSGYSFWENLNEPSSTFYHEFQSVVGYEEKLNVCFQSLAFTGCQYKQCIYFDPSTLVPCTAHIEPILENPNHLSLNVKPTGTPPFQISWFNESSSSAIVVPIQDSLSEIYASVSVTDALGNRTELYQSIRVQNGIVDPCYFPIDLVSIRKENLSPDIFNGRVEVLYRDAQGTEWRSTAGVQDEDAHVILGQLQAYGISPLLQESYVMDLSIRARLFQMVTGESRLFETSRLTLALSHP